MRVIRWGSRKTQSGNPTSNMLPKMVHNGATGMTANRDMPPDVIKSGYLKKLKTMKKKFFLLRCETDSGPARLEYYDSEKKWRLSNVNGGGNGSANSVVPKRSIVLKTCFNINKKLDSKQKHAIALYTRDDCFAMAMDTDAELEEWLTLLLALQQGHSDVMGDLSLLDKESKPKPNFEHVWQVTVKSKGLGSSKSIGGPHRLCLTSVTLSLIKMGAEMEAFDFPLMSIRRCGHSDCFFFMELGRSACTGAGELWMQTEDTIIAQNMHEAILGAMKSSRSHEDLDPLARPRSSSTSENSKMMATRPVGVVHPQMPSAAVSTVSMSNIGQSPMTQIASSLGGGVGGGGPRDRCDSMPTRSRTVSEGHHDIAPRTSYYFEMARPHSTYNHSISYSPPVANNPLSPTSGAYSDSADSSLSIDDFESPSDYHHNRYLGHPSDCAVHQTEPTITEEGNDDYQSMTPECCEQTSDNHQQQPNDYLQMKVGGGKSSSQRSSLTSMFLNLNTNSSSSINNTPTEGFNSPTSSSAAFNQSKTNLGGIGRSMSQTESSKRNSAGGGSNSSGYIEMTSPLTPSLPDNILEGYIPMSPGTSININKVPHASLEPDSQSSYAGSDWSDAYMPMDQSDENRSTSSSYQQRHSSSSQNNGYLDMRMNICSSLPKAGYTMMGGNLDLSSPSRSTNSLQDMSCSCSPAEGFHLDKVKSFFPPSEDLDSDDYIKPVRAYSIGSRPQLRKSHLGSHLEQHRVRAFSFGSQAHTGRSDSSSHRSHGNGAASATTPQGNYSAVEAELGALRNLDSSKVSKKSSSAPLLPSRPPHNGPNAASPGCGHTTPTTRIVRPSSNSVQPNEDWMEINYAQPTNGEHSSRRYASSGRPRTNSRSSTNSALSAALKSPHSSCSNTPTNSSNTTKTNDKSHDNNNVVKPKQTTTGDKLNRVVSLDSSNYMELSIKALPTKEEAKNTDYMEMAVDPKSGDYVNLDLSKATWQLESTVESNSVPNTKTAPHSYMNLNPPIPPVITTVSSINTTTELASNYSDYAVMSPVTEFKVSSPSTTEILTPTPDMSYENIKIGQGSCDPQSERELNYASLDLAPPDDDRLPRSPRTSKPEAVTVALQEENGNAAEGGAIAPLSYAQIDFTKSEGLRNVSGSLREGRV